jgi:hypothetical protein
MLKTLIFCDPELGEEAIRLTVKFWPFKVKLLLKILTNLLKLSKVKMFAASEML